MVDTRIVLECRDVSKLFIKGRDVSQILFDLNFKVERNKVTVINGKSGEGKILLVWLLSGLDLPTSGEIIIDGVDITKLNNTELSKFRREKIRIIFQDSNLIPTWTASQPLLRLYSLEAAHPRYAPVSMPAHRQWSPAPIPCAHRPRHRVRGFAGTLFRWTE